MRSCRTLRPATRAAILAVLFLAGCRTTPHRERIHVDMTRDGGAVIAGTAFGPHAIVAGLRKAGAGPDTRIEVTLPAGRHAASIGALARTLSTAGYRLVHFRTPKRATSFVE